MIENIRINNVIENPVSLLVKYIKCIHLHFPFIIFRYTELPSTEFCKLPEEAQLRSSSFVPEAKEECA